MAEDERFKVVPTERFSTLEIVGDESSSTSDAAVAAKAEASKVETETSSAKKEQQQQQSSSSSSSKANKKKNKPQQQNTKPHQKPPKPPLREWNDELQRDFDLILSVGEECITQDELRNLLLRKGRGSSSSSDDTSGDANAAIGFNLYDGFEPSGRMHIAQGVFKAVNVNKCTHDNNNGATFVFWVADWFALMNDKMGGDLQKIQTVGHYLIEVWKAAGMNLQNVVFKWASAEITNHADTYWPLMLDVARRFNVTRIKKCCQIMGRLEGSLTAAQVLYPLMQCTDVFFLKADICQLGVDQRKVNMLAREYCDYDKKRRKFKPVILSHHMLYGLKAGQEKMSKSDPDSAVFMEDSAVDVERKIRAAYCPTLADVVVVGDNDGDEDGAAADLKASATTTTVTQDGSVEVMEDDAGKASMHLTKDTLKNPCLDYIQNIILSPPGATFTAAGVTYTNFDDVKAAFLDGNLSKDELKTGLITELNRLLEPVRQHFETDERAKDLLEKVRQYKKESLTITDHEKTVRRLNLVELEKVKAGTHLVFAPLPHARPTLQEALDVLSQLRAAGNDCDGDAKTPCVLVLPDWSATVCDACNADAKAIAAYFMVLTKTLMVLDEATMQNVQILLQSEAILADPSNYWISVINVGRHFMLDDVMGAGMEDSEGVGIVIARLMLVADVAGVEPVSLALAEDANIEQSMIDTFFKEQLPAMTAPTITRNACPPIRLQPERETEALKTDNDEYFLLDDPKVHGKSKLNKAFCEPGNVDFCPPLAVASVFSFGEFRDLSSTPGTLQVKRSEKNGGDKSYTALEAVVADFSSEALHPADLKSSVAAILVGILDKLSSAIKADKAVTQASKCLKALQKKKK